VTVRDGDLVIGRVTADPRGEWVLLPERPLQPGNRSLTLAAKVPGKDEIQTGTNDVLIAVPQPPAQQVAAAAPSAESEAADTTRAATALALLVPHAGGDVARPLQVPGQSSKGEMPAGPKGLALDIIEYDATGKVALAGRAEAGTVVNLYLNDKLVAEANAGSDGHWSAKPSGDIAAGLYQLRIDALGRDGRVASRLALPFQRAEAAHELAPGDRFTVQPGNSLWRIARRSYGSGMRYAVIFAANRDQIADPNRIYPGQVVKLPSVN
jgi:nucleoid-associated protein YgaU